MMQRGTSWLTRIAPAMAGALLLSCAAHAQNATIDWQTFSNGGTRATSPQHILLMNVGQNFVDVISGSNRVLRSGFMVHPLITGTVVSVPEEETLPTTFNLDQNYPNPFNPSTSIRFAIPRESNVQISIYNLLGQLIAVPVNDMKPAGHHTLVWHGTNATGTKVGSGVYFYRIVAQPVDGGNPFVALKKMIMVK